MAERSKSRRNKNSRFYQNKMAFEDVLGNPFVKPESVQGHYERFRTKSAVNAMVYSDESNSTRNDCKPSIVDFLCDVDNVVSRAMETHDRVSKFWRTYLIDDDDTLFTPDEREEIEQRIGAELLERKISPVLGYFQTERKPGMMTRK